MIRPATSSSGTGTTEVPASPTIEPQRPSAARSTAATPNRVANTRSRDEGTAAHDVTQGGEATLHAAAAFQFLGHHAADPTQPPVSKLVGFVARHVECALGEHRALGHHHDRGVPAQLSPTLDHGHHVVDVERHLGYQDRGRAPGQPGVECDVAHVSPHHLDHHGPLVGLGGGVQSVDGVGGHADRGVEPKCLVGAGDVIVDGLWHPDAGHSVDAQIPRSAQRSVAADHDDPVETQTEHGLPHTLDPIIELVGLNSGRTQNGATTGQQAPAALHGQGLVVTLQHAAPCVGETDHLSTERPLCPAHHGTDDGIQARAVAAGGQHS